MNASRRRSPLDDEPEREALRDRLLDAMALHAAFDGWSRQAMTAAAEDEGVSFAEATLLFPGGAAEMVEAFARRADRRMMEAIEHEDLSALKVRERVALAVRLRLEVHAGQREAVRRSLSFLAQPQHSALALKMLYRTVDAVWQACGDRSTDYNFYTKRLLLSGVYSSTLLVWLDDNSPGNEKTWRFLDRRIDDVLKVGGRLGRAVKGLEDLPYRFLRRARP